MPWEIRQGAPQCSGYGVFKEGTNELEGCHETKEKAQAQMAALYSTEEMDKAKKAWTGSAFSFRTIVDNTDNP